MMHGCHGFQKMVSRRGALMQIGGLGMGMNAALGRLLAASPSYPSIRPRAKQILFLHQCSSMDAGP